MANILIHYRRSVSDPNKPFKSESGEIIEFDNVTLYYAELDRFGAGVVLPKDLTMSSAKLKTAEFEQITSYSFEAFQASFVDTFFGRDISVWYEQRYGKLIPRSVQFGDETYIQFTDAAKALFKKIMDKLIPAEQLSDKIPF